MFQLFDRSDSQLRHIRKKVNKVVALAEKYSDMTDDELKGMTGILRGRLDKGETLDDVYADAFATAREAAKRVTGEYPYVEQLIGGTILHEGNVSEQKTGEGKSLTAVMPVYLNALSGKGVHVVTVNEYLAERDAVRIGQIYEWLGLTVGINLHDKDSQQKKEAYACDITYTSNSELGFDYLRDNMTAAPFFRTQRGLNFALVDEADSVLIDDARTPLIISQQGECDFAYYSLADRLAKRLKPEDYEVDPRTKTVQLTLSGMEKAEKAFGVDSLYIPQTANLLHYIMMAMKANYTLAKDIDYLVDPNTEEIMIIDPNTGRALDGRKWSDGLHQAVEAKESCPINPESKTMATITYQNFFRLYDKLAGMTGTAKTEEEEFLEIYNMYVIQVPTHRPVVRIDYPDAIFGTKRAKYEALVNEAVERHAKGQPVLIGTISVETSEIISDLLKKKGITHQVLNAKNPELEADIIALAGQKGAVTIATNMAGRGTDIKLGEGVTELGGLCVLGSERHESRRIDNQLRGRSGRQGDPGCSRFYVSMQDDLMVRFGSERLERFLKNTGDEQLESRSFSKTIENAQKRIEGVNYDARKQLLKYDNVLSDQRKVMYEQRNFILDHSDVHEMTLDMITKGVKSAIVVNEDGTVDQKNTKKALEVIGIHPVSSLDQAPDRVAQEVAQESRSGYDAKITPVFKEFIPYEKQAMLRIFDGAWARHIDTMDKLRNGIGLRGYAQKDPLQAYVEEGYVLFDEMTADIAKCMTGFCMFLSVTEQPTDEKEDLSDGERNDGQ